MERTFRDRVDAGQQLAAPLSVYANRDDAIVLALPRGGVPVAYEVAKRLHLPLDVFVVRKLGVPGYEELALGAIASGGVRVLNQDVVRVLPNADQIVEAVTANELVGDGRRERAIAMTVRRSMFAAAPSFLLMMDLPRARRCMQR